MKDETHLIHDYLTGEATDDERRRLEAWMKQDASHVDLFVRESFLHHDLHEALRETVSDPPVADARRESAPSGSNGTARGSESSMPLDVDSSQTIDPLSGADPRGSSSVFYVWGSGIRPWLVPAFLVLVVGTICWLVHGLRPGESQSPSPVAGAAPAAPSVATVEETTECVWDESFHCPRHSGARVSPGQLLGLAGGTAKVRFDCGATVTLKGPALLEIDTGMDATLLRGHLSVNVPNQALGFLVHTDEVDVRDLGTEFKMNVDDGGQTSVEVVDGKVEADLTRDEKSPKTTHSLGVGEFLRTGRDPSREEWGPGRLSVFRGVRLDFTVPQTLDLLSIVRENTDHYRYDPSRGCLSVDTTWGNVFGQYKPGENLFLLPAPKDADFDVVLSVASFVPERFCEHVGLLILRDRDNYARIIYAMHHVQQRRYVQFNTEAGGRPNSRVFEPVELGTGPFQLRLVRRGADVSGWWSRDGKHWTLRDHGKAPSVIRYVGFYASKGNSYPVDGTPYRRALIEKFEIETRDASHEANPNSDNSPAPQ